MKRLSLWDEEMCAYRTPGTYGEEMLAEVCVSECCVNDTPDSGTGGREVV